MDTNLFHNKGGVHSYIAAVKTRHCGKTMFRQSSSFPPHGLQDTQYVQKQINKVKIEIDGSENIFFGRQLVHDEVSVEYNEATEDDGTSD